MAAIAIKTFHGYKIGDFRSRQIRLGIARLELSGQGEAEGGELMDNMTIFDMLYPAFKIDKPVRLIELFAGIGSQAMALRDLGVQFEHYRVVEFDKYAIASYNAIHNTKFPTTDIRDIKGEDLGIIDTNKYCYILTYSFPCQDLSVAGKMKGMAKGSGTRSGLLWEVERLLNEVQELPQVLLMENVPQVVSDANIKDFHLWQDFLAEKGYTNYVDILNAKDYGVAQNRERCFMVSLLGKWNYKFPQPIPLTKTMKDYLEDEVDEKYYINSEKAKKLIQQLVESGQLEGCIGNINPSSNGINGNVYGSDGTSPTITTNKGEGPKICINISKQGAILSGYGTKLEKFTDCATTIMARDYKGFGNQSTNGVIDREKVKQIGNYDTESTWDNPQTGRVYSADGISPTLNTCSGGDRQPKIVEPQIKQVGNLTENAKRDNPQRRRVYDTTGISPALCEQMGTGGNLQPFIVASRGRNPQNPSDRTPGNYVEQRLEPNSQGICNTLTSVQKDNLVLEPCKYRIRKLTPRECWRLMDFPDKDYDKAAAVNSNTQLYKQAGNSIVRAVLMAIFKQML